MGRTHTPEDGWERRLRTYPPLVVTALILAFVIVAFSADGSSTSTGRLGGDFPAFYGAGTIVNGGAIADLYDPATQAAAQSGLLGGEDGFIMYPYAPHVAAGYAPLAALPYRAAYAVHTAVMMGALVAALWLMRPMIGIVDRWFGATVAMTVTAYPVFVGVTGGQNTALSLLLIAAAWRAWHADRDALAGIALALLSFRPQYALPLLGLALLDRRFRTVMTASIGMGLVWAANAVLFGVDWVRVWLRKVTPLLEADATVNATNEIAPIGTLQALLGADSMFALVVGGAISLAVGCGFVWLWWRRPVGLTERMAITTCGLVLLGPHAIYYDSTLVAIGVFVLLDRGRVSGWTVGIVWAGGLTHLAADTLGASPLIAVIVAMLVVSGRALLGDDDQAADGSERVLPIHDS